MEENKKVIKFTIEEATREIYYGILHDYVEIARRHIGVCPKDIEEIKPLRVIIDYMENKYKFLKDK